MQASASVAELTACQAPKHDLGQARDGIPERKDVQDVLVGVLEALLGGNASDGGQLRPDLQPYCRCSTWLAVALHSCTDQWMTLIYRDLRLLLVQVPMNSSSSYRIHRP